MAVVSAIKGSKY